MKFLEPIPEAQLQAEIDAGTTLQLANTEDVQALDPARLAAARRIVLQFPKWVDGRAYSQARLLRARLGFGGEIRATGEVLVDMVPLLARCGVDVAELAPGQSTAAADRALGFFPGHYQSDVREPEPRFVRDAGA